MFSIEKYNRKSLFLTSLLGIACFFFCLSTAPVQAQGLFQEEQEQIILKGKIKEVVSQKTEFLPGPDIEQTVQLLKVEILNGDKKGEVIEMQNDFVILEEGDRIFLNYLLYLDGTELYTFEETNRVRGLFLFII